MRTKVVPVLVLLSAALLTACSPSKKALLEEERESYTIANYQLPAEDPYGRTGWVQPPAPLAKSPEGRAWETQGAPLLEPPSRNVQAMQPKLPSANRASRKY